MMEIIRQIDFRLTVLNDIQEVKAFLKENINIFRDTFGVLLFLYSVMCSRVSKE